MRGVATSIRMIPFRTARSGPDLLRFPRLDSTLIIAVVLETFPIHEGKYRQDEQTLVTAVTTNSRGNPHPASEWISKPLYLDGDYAGNPRTRDNPSG